MEIRKYINSNLKNAGVEPSELRAETNFIMENLLNISNPYMDYDLDVETKCKLSDVFEQRKKGMPLQYIIGVADFMGEKFHVSGGVLIPRPETELLVIKAISKAQNFETPKILDIGSGSGCVAIMLARKLKNAKIYSCDISDGALDIAKLNAQNLQVYVEFVHSDLFSDINEKFDIIVSNPPYIPMSEKKKIQREVTFEPDSALYTNDSFGIEFYEKIICDAVSYLNDNGYLIFELGAGQSELVKNLFVEYNYKKIEIAKDLEGNDRIISARI